MRRTPLRGSMTFESSQVERMRMVSVSARLASLGYEDETADHSGLCAEAHQSAFAVWNVPRPSPASISINHLRLYIRLAWTRTRVPSGAIGSCIEPLTTRQGCLEHYLCLLFGSFHRTGR